MKKFLALACSIALVAGFISCGPSEEERKQDSADAAQTGKDIDNEADSIIAAMNAMNDASMKEDSIANAKKKEDSIRTADSIAKAGKKK